MTTNIRYWAAIPAAGVGTRMQAEVPKQYLSLNNKAILAHTLELFCSHPRIEGVVVAISAKDKFWPTLDISSHSKIIVAEGGVERCHSVLNGLNALLEKANGNDWVLVHDAARPCLRTEDVDSLIDTLIGHEIGGLLGLPARDTMKRVDESCTVQETVEREDLWHALTPQMFHLGILMESLKNALSKDIVVTDEAQAIELNGLRPVLVEGHSDNIKITYNYDLALAELYLSQQEKE